MPRLNAADDGSSQCLYSASHQFCVSQGFCLVGTASSLLETYVCNPPICSHNSVWDLLIFVALKFDSSLFCHLILDIAVSCHIAHYAMALYVVP
jgi:hypothetical protein